MIRYYAYYSCGGYKDLYLGNSTLKTEYTYFLPLLATWQKGAKPEYAEKLKQIEGLQQIEVISKENSFDYPIQAKNLFSHGGYRVIYLTLSNGDSCLCVRDITNGAKDEEDRDIPFNILITASGEDDIKILDQFCLDSLKQENGVYGMMSSLFSYDPQVNGIKFHLGKLNSTIYDAPISNKELEHKSNHVNFLIIDSAAMASTAMHELDLNKEQIDYIKSNDGKYSGSLAYRATSTSEEPPIHTLNHKTLKDDSEKQESIDEIHTTSEGELNQQYLDIQKVLSDLTEQTKKIGEVLDLSKSKVLSNVTNILNQINSLKNDISKPLPILPAQHKDVDSVTISKIHLWIAGIALIVGFLLGALIF